MWQHDWDLFPYKLSTGLTQAGRQGGNSDQQSQGPRDWKYSWLQAALEGGVINKQSVKQSSK